MEGKFDLDDLYNLMKNKEIQIQDGVFVKIGNEINWNMKFENGRVVITPQSPNIYLRVTKIGLLLNKILQPKLIDISYDEETIDIRLKGLPDVSLKR